MYELTHLGLFLFFLKSWGFDRAWLNHKHTYSSYLTTEPKLNWKDRWSLRIKSVWFSCGRRSSSVSLWRVIVRGAAVFLWLEWATDERSQEACLIKTHPLYSGAGERRISCKHTHICAALHTFVRHFDTDVFYLRDNMEETKVNTHTPHLIYSPQTVKEKAKLRYSARKHDH